ncbi:MAG: hypothetical protein J5509_10210 [Lachnospiraceae bacterium]|nr:hypothetical protein [Lachnospiraceae bacterium]
MKKKLLTALVIGMIMTAAAGCGKQEDTPSDAQTTDTAVTDTADDTTTTDAADTTDANVSMANPWVETSYEEVKEFHPFLFNAPEGATNVVWRKLEGSESDSASGSPLVELDFTLDGMDFNARTQFGAAEDADISGMYYDWDVTEDVTFSNWRDGYMTGKMSRAIGDDETADLITWYDIEIGIAYSLSVVAPDLDGFDISAVADAMYVPENAPGSDIPDDDDMEVEEEHVMTTDIEGKDTFTQIVDALPDGTGYTNEKVGDEDVLLVAGMTFEAGEEYPWAIDSEIFWYDNGTPAYLGYVTSGGTAYPLMIKDGKLYTAGNHFVQKYVVTDGKLMIMEEAIETFNTDGEATYTYDSDDGGDYSNMSQEDAHAAYDSLFEEYFGADIVAFNAIKK